jgi:hypothetical protein
LGACAAALPGHIPEGGRNKAMERVKAMDPGTVDPAGTYVPSSQERELDCKKLRGSMLVMIARIKDGGRTPEPSATSATAQSAIAALRGKALMQDAAGIDRRERARLDAYNRLLAEKKCPTMDVAAELAVPAPAAPKASPAPAAKAAPR